MRIFAEKLNKALVLFFVTSFFILLPAAAQAKKMDILNFNKGETPTDGIKAEVSLSEEHALKKNAVTLKVKATEDGGACIAECPPKKGVWGGFDFIKLGIFNPTGKPLKFIFVIKPTTPIKYQDRYDAELLVKPGKNDLEIALTGVSTNGGGALVLKDRIAIWSLSPVAIKKDDSYFVQYFRACTQDEIEKDEKAGVSGNLGAE